MAKRSYTHEELTEPEFVTIESDPLKRKHRKAKLKLTQARARAALADAITAENLAETSTIALSREKDRNDWMRGADSYSRVYHFEGEVTENSVRQAMDVMSRWHRLDLASGHTDRPIVFRISSEGGAILPGTSLYTFLRDLAKVRPVITIASGLCASMATVIHQAGSTRLVEERCSYLIHDASAYAEGTLGSMEDTMDFVKKLNQQGHEILAERSRLSVEDIAKLSKRKDWWLLGAEVVEHGFADSFGSIFSVPTAVGG